MLYSLKTPDVDRRWFIERVFDVLTRYISRDVIVNVRKGNPHLEWTTNDFEVIIDNLTDVITSVVALNTLKPVERRAIPGPRLDRVGQARDNASLSDWIEKHRGNVYYVKSDNADALQALERRASETKTLRRRKDGSEYHLAAFSSDAEATEILNGLFSPTEFRKFVTKN